MPLKIDGDITVIKKGWLRCVELVSALAVCPKGLWNNISAAAKINFKRKIILK
jgi:hypothetical protein